MQLRDLQHDVTYSNKSEWDTREIFQSYQIEVTKTTHNKALLRFCPAFIFENLSECVVLFALHFWHMMQDVWELYVFPHPRHTSRYTNKKRNTTFKLYNFCSFSLYMLPCYDSSAGKILHISRQYINLEVMLQTKRLMTWNVMPE